MSMNRYDLTAGYPLPLLSGTTLMYISASKYEGDWHSIPHAHGFSELFFVTGGKGRFQIQDTLFPVAAGDMVIVEPQVEHTETSLDAAPLEYFVLGIDGLPLPPDPAGQCWRYISFREDIQAILEPMRTILRENQARGTGYEVICQNMLSVLLVQLARRIGFGRDSTAPKAASRESIAARRYIDNHYRENLTLDTLAQAVHISKYHLAHIFSREYGISPIGYMQQLRLQECRELLRTTDYSVAQVARMTGFSSPSYFSQRFHKAQGMSPAQYRRHSRETE